MDQPFDCNLEKGRLELADLLPKIDDITLTIDRVSFIEPLATVSRFLGAPDWLVYQWGSFRPFKAGPHKLVFSLPQVLDVGVHLRALSAYENFNVMLKGFSNPTQFEDTLFEAKVAYLFHSSPGVSRLRFAPEYTVRGRLKRPEFEAESRQGRVCVECKRPHLDAQKALQSLHRVAKHFKVAIARSSWPKGMRLEVEITEPVRGDVASIASAVVQHAVANGIGAGPIRIGPFECHPISRQEDFKLPSSPWHTDTMVLDEDVAVQLLDPKFTQLRVADYSLDAKFERSVGARINEALRQLPESEKCMIFIGGVSPRIARPVCEKRLQETAYSHIALFGIYQDDRPLFVVRQHGVEFARGIFGAAEPAADSAQQSNAPDC